MCCINIARSKAVQTFKNKHIKGALKHSKQFALDTSASYKCGWCCAEDNNYSRESAIIGNMDKGRTTTTTTGWKAMPVVCVVAAVLGVVVPSSAAEQEKPITINRPVMRSSSDPQPWVRYSADYVRCFCNLPQCVSTGYMCKSNGGGCFSDLLDQSYSQEVPPSAYRGRHGCVELLTNKEQRAWCKNNPTNSYATIGQRRKSHPRTLLVCCYHDMCNHADSPETGDVIHNTLLDNLPAEKDKHIETVINEDSSGYTNPDVWFKAATIAVPICGAVILFVLIALAVRILRTESLNSTNCKLGSALYLNSPRSQGKHHCGGNAHKHYNRNYENVLCNPIVPNNNHHSYSNHNEDLQRHTLVPLLVQNETSGVYGCKDAALHKVNLFQYDDGKVAPNVIVLDNGDEVCSKYHDICYNNVNISDKNSCNKLTDVRNMYDKEKVRKKDFL